MDTEPFQAAGRETLSRLRDVQVTEFRAWALKTEHSDGSRRCCSSVIIQKVTLSLMISRLAFTLYIDMESLFCVMDLSPFGISGSSGFGLSGFGSML